MPSTRASGGNSNSSNNIRPHRRATATTTSPAENSDDDSDDDSDMSSSASRNRRKGNNNINNNQRNNPKLSLKASEVTSDPTGSKKCSFCQQGFSSMSTDPVFSAGKFYSLGDKHFFHYFCVLFSRDGAQRGRDEQGLFGFFLPDIERELTRGAKLRCDRCKRPGATVQCGKQGCKASYHFPCGNKSGAVFLFKDVMRSFCVKHVPKQTRKVKHDICQAGCLDKTTDKERCLVCPCCGRRYHIACLQSMSLRSGRAHYKCPMCSEKDLFLKESLNFGVYVPEQDAAWEEEEDEDFYQFSGMGRLHQRCDAGTCVCPKGREYHMAGTDFETIRCNYCGCKGVHIKCGGLDKRKPDFICEDHGSNNSNRGNVRTLTPPSTPAATTARKKLRRSQESSSSDNSDSPASDDDSDTSIDDDLVEAKMSEVKRSFPAAATGSAQDDDDDDDEIMIVEEVVKTPKTPVMCTLRHREEIEEEEERQRQHLRRTNSIAGLLSDVAAASSSSAPKVTSPVFVPVDMSAVASTSKGGNESPVASNPRLRVISFGSSGIGSINKNRNPLSSGTSVSSTTAAAPIVILDSSSSDDDDDEEDGYIEID